MDTTCKMILIGLYMIAMVALVCAGGWVIHKSFWNSDKSRGTIGILIGGALILGSCAMLIFGNDFICSVGKVECPDCGNETLSTYCEVCGYEVNPVVEPETCDNCGVLCDTNYCGKCGAAQSNVCDNCGTECDTAYCSNCGAALK